jgi:gamma-glutamylputrescine oxidase
MNLSYWERDFLLGKPDITVIGAGIVGLSCALYLKKANPALDILVLERGVLPCGASTKNAGFACFGSLTELIDDVENNGIDNMLALVEKRWKGLQLLQQNLGPKNIDFQALGGYELFTPNDLEVYPDLAGQIEAYNELLKPIFNQDVFSMANEKITSFGFNGISSLLFNQFEGQINTGLMMKTLLNKVRAAGVQVINSVTINTITEEAGAVRLDTSIGIIRTKQLAVCTNAFTKQLLPEIAVTPGRAQVLITEPIKNLSIKGTFHYDRGYYYFRNINNRLLIGGGRNVDPVRETTTEMETTEVILHEIKQLLNHVILPNTDYTIDTSWAGIMGLGESKKVIVKNHSKRIAVGVRLGGMGVAIGSEIGNELATLVSKKDFK